MTHAACSSCFAQIWRQPFPDTSKAATGDDPRRSTTIRLWSSPRSPSEPRSPSPGQCPRRLRAEYPVEPASGGVEVEPPPVFGRVPLKAVCWNIGCFWEHVFCFSWGTLVLEPFWLTLKRKEAPSIVFAVWGKQVRGPCDSNGEHSQKWLAETNHTKPPPPPMHPPAIKDQASSLCPIQYMSLAPRCNCSFNLNITPCTLYTKSGCVAGKKPANSL